MIQPVAFLSYAHRDDQNGRLTTLRERLSEEIAIQLGSDFPIFQDNTGIAWGQNWAERLEQAIGEQVTFFIPIITPSFFQSEACREELTLFIEREKHLDRNDLILPIYYVECNILSDSEKLKENRLATIIATRQYADWRGLRFEPFTSPQVGKTLANLAVQICKAIERGQITHDVTKIKRLGMRKQEELSSIGEADASDEEAGGEILTPTLSAKTEPPTHVVDQLHRGNFTTIANAIQAAKPGDRILIRPGFYQEGIVMDKPLEIIGDGDLSEIIIQATGKNTLLFKTTMGRVSNLTFQKIGDDKRYCISLAQGRLELEGCDISSQSATCVGIFGGADPRLRRNRIHHGKLTGVIVYDGGQGTLEDNDIFGNTLAGVAIKDNSNPILRGNRISDGKSYGVSVYDNGQGTFEDNDIFGNSRAGVTIKKGGNPTLRRNRIYSGKQSGVYIHDNGQGTLEDNDIFANANSGVTIQNGGNPTLHGNRINKNASYALNILIKGRGVIEDNDLRNNAKGAWNISTASEATVKRARNQE